MPGAGGMGKIGSDGETTQETRRRRRGRGRGRGGGGRGKPKQIQGLISADVAIGLQRGLPYIYRARKMHGSRGSEKRMWPCDVVKLMQPRLFLRRDEVQIVCV